MGEAAGGRGADARKPSNGDAGTKRAGYCEDCWDGSCVGWGLELLIVELCNFSPRDTLRGLYLHVYPL